LQNGNWLFVSHLIPKLPILFSPIFIIAILKLKWINVCNVIVENNRIPFSDILLCSAFIIYKYLHSESFFSDGHCLLIHLMNSSSSILHQSQYFIIYQILTLSIATNFYSLLCQPNHFQDGLSFFYIYLNLVIPIIDRNFYGWLFNIFLSQAFRFWYSSVDWIKKYLNK
jgi:hypothetical protein